VKAIIGDVGWVNGLAAIGSLGRAGIPVLALDHRASPLGFRSRYAQPVRAPDPAEDEDGFIAAVAKVGPGERPAVPRPPYVDAVFARDDLRPGLVHMARVARSVLS
jgi:hypothetical protein